jgi:hypothetical protein
MCCSDNVPYAQCHFCDKFSNDVSDNADTECHYAVCCYAECRGIPFYVSAKNDRKNNVRRFLEYPPGVFISLSLNLLYVGKKALFFTVFLASFILIIWWPLFTTFLHIEPK